MRAKHDPGCHGPSCSGPDNCDEYFSVLQMAPREYARWLFQDTVRLRAATNRGTLRVGTNDTYAPPDIYAEGLARLRGEHVSVSSPVLRTNANPYSPPDAYASALAVMRARNETETRR